MKETDCQNLNDQYEEVADNGLLDRRLFLKRTFALAGGGSACFAVTNVQAQSLSDPGQFPEWMTQPGTKASEYGQPSQYVADVKRIALSLFPVTPQISVSLTPLEKLQGTITPNGLHFERHHSGVPTIDPSRHNLKVHGLVNKPLKFSYENLLRYPMHSSFHFIECSGNGVQDTLGDEPRQGSCGSIHGLVSNSEWSGIKLSTLLEEAGLKSGATWLHAAGADGSSLVRSIPIEKAMDDTLLALYQNGEPIRPEQGYPMRLLVPGWEGNLNVKWVHNIKIADGPAHSRDETARYTDMLVDGRARQFTFPMGVKSVITHPSGAMKLDGPGYYELAGLAWSGHGVVTKVEVSADGGGTWAEAALSEPRLPRSLLRFRIPWHWNGAAAILQSRAIDDKGNVQPTRRENLSQYKPKNGNYHFNGIQSWQVTSDGDVRNIHV